MQIINSKFLHVKSIIWIFLKKRRKERMTNVIELIKEAIDDKKGKDIIVIDVKGKVTYTDYIIICTGSSDVNIKAISDSVKKKLFENGMDTQGIKTEGYDNATWILMDCQDAVVHIFNAEMRDYYKLEKIWS